MPGGFGALLLRPDALPDANRPLFVGLGPAGSVVCWIAHHRGRGVTKCVGGDRRLILGVEHFGVGKY